MEPDLSGGGSVIVEPGDDVAPDLPLVVIGVGEGAELGWDVVVPDRPAAEAVAASVAQHPVAATALALLLRGGERRTTFEGLVAESATYSTLQAGADHRRWLAEKPPPKPRAPAWSVE